jgi:hypothetical protein
LEVEPKSACGLGFELVLLLPLLVRLRQHELRRLARSAWTKSRALRDRPRCGLLGASEGSYSAVPVSKPPRVSHQTRRSTAAAVGRVSCVGMRPEPCHCQIADQIGPAHFWHRRRTACQRMQSRISCLQECARPLSCWACCPSARAGVACAEVLSPFPSRCRTPGADRR